MFYVYLIRSCRNRRRIYVGYSEDLKQRISDHNAGHNVSTRSGRPWELEFYMGFRRKKAALDFEAYLKTASGKAFANKRLLSEQRADRGK